LTTDRQIKEDHHARQDRRHLHRRHIRCGQSFRDHALIGQAASIPVGAASPVVSVSPVTLLASDRTVDLQMRISAPTTGRDLPIILLSHGHGRSNHLSSLNGYGPLASFWAAHGFVVIQPTHLSSKSLSLDPASAGGPLFWRSRIEDMTRILDQLEVIEACVPQITGRLDRSRVAVAGHSMGGHTASMLLGAQLTDPDDGTLVDLAEPRIKAGVLLAAPGNGGDDLSAYAYENYSFFRHISFAGMTTPALVVTGDADVSPHLTVRGADWHADPYRLSSGPKSLLTLKGGGHGLGGIAGYDAAETDDESIERVAVVQRLTWAYLRSALYPEDTAWSEACAALDGLAALGRVEAR
jgi:pimeloyl-ACP methyl ester carboxylesterase